jgi:hypothetical protein
MFVGKRREGGGGGREDQIGKAMVGHQATVRDVFPCDEPQGCTCPLKLMATCTFGSFGFLHPLFLLSTLLENTTNQNKREYHHQQKPKRICCQATLY